MASKSVNNKGTYIENMQVTGGKANLAGRDINLYHNKDDLSLRDFNDLLSEIKTELKAAKLPKTDEKDIKANIDIALNQTQKKEPKKRLILGPLTTALELITQVGGAAQSIETLVTLLNKAIVFAQKMF